MEKGKQLGLEWAMLLCFVQIGFWIELPVQRRLCLIFVKIMDLGKWDITMRYRVTRYPRVFRRLTIGQRTLGFLGFTIKMWARKHKYTHQVYVVQWLVKCRPTRRSVLTTEFTL